MTKRKLTGRGAVPPSGKRKEFVRNSCPEDPNQPREIAPSSVYLSLCRRASNMAPEACPLYKVDVPDSSLPGATRESPRWIAALDIDVNGKTFISLPSGWIIGVGGDPGGTIIVDTKTASLQPKVIRGPDPLAAKWSPILAAVGNKVYALANCPNYKTKPNFVPWFEVLDLSKGTVTENADGSLSLDGCLWEDLSWPACFPRRLTPSCFTRPPIIVVRSYVVVLPYILISLNWTINSKCTYAFDTKSGQWHGIDKSLPFVGAATPHGSVFLASSLEKGSVNAYRIRVVSTVSGGASSKACALNLSITAFSIRNMAREEVGTMQGTKHIISLGRGRFSLLTYSLANHKGIMTSYCEDPEIYSTKLFAKLTTYDIDNLERLVETADQGKWRAINPVIAVSKQREQLFQLSSPYGFSSLPIPFAVSIQDNGTN